MVACAAPSARKRTALSTAAFLVLIVSVASAQTPPPASGYAQPAPPIAAPPAAAPPAQAAPSPPADKPGFFDALGNWVKKSAVDFDSGLKKIKSSIDDFNANADKSAKDAVNATKEAADALVKFPSTRFVDGRERCLISSNGSPDCRAAAEIMCKAKGFQAGNSVDTQATQKCSVRVWLSGRPKEGDCPVETFVTRAACQ